MSERARERERKKGTEESRACLPRQRRKQEAGDAIQKELLEENAPNHENTICRDHTKEGNQPVLRPRGPNHNVYCKITAS